MIRAAVAIVRRPDLWVTAIRQARRTSAPGWWKRPPFLPIPSGEYLRFRMLTQYGTSDRRPDPDDVISYLAWCKEWDAASR